VREGVKLRQILVDIHQTQDLDTFKDDTPTIIEEKVNRAIQETRGDPTEHKVKVTTCLRNGGIIMELDSNEAVK
jgi:hypothetical protein